MREMTKRMSPAENEHDFMLHPHEIRRLKRQQSRTVIGTRESSGRLKGATSGRDMLCIVLRMRQTNMKLSYI